MMIFVEHAGRKYLIILAFLGLVCDRIVGIGGDTDV